MKKPEPWPGHLRRGRADRRAGPAADHPDRRSGGRSAPSASPAGTANPSLLSSFLATFSLMLTLTEITDGFTRSTMSAKPTGCATLLHLVVDLRMRAGWRRYRRLAGGAKAIDGDAEAGDDRGHQRETARRQQRARAADRTGSDERSVGRSVIRDSPKSLNQIGAGAHTVQAAEDGVCALRRAGGGVKVW